MLAERNQCPERQPGRWLDFHLRNSTLLTDASKTFMHFPSMVVDTVPSIGPFLTELLLGSGYGMAWMTVSSPPGHRARSLVWCVQSDYRGYRRVFHGGDVLGFHGVHKHAAVGALSSLACPQRSST
jgi:hypothetical protein